MFREKIMCLAAVAMALAVVITAQCAVVGPITGTDVVTVSADAELHGSAAPEGVLRIAGGTLSVRPEGNESVTLPSALKSKLSLWLDATTNVVVDAEKGGVVQWLDARETPVTSLSDLAARESSGDFTYVRAKALLNSSKPVFNATPPQLVNFAALGGRPAVDFGEYQTDSRWLYFTQGNGTAPKRVNTTSFVGLVAFHNSFGFVLGDVTNLVAEGGNIIYHKSQASSLAGYISDVDSKEAARGYTRAETRLNGVRIKPWATSFIFHEKFQIFSNVGPVFDDLSNGTNKTPFASALFNGANYRKDSGSGKSAHDRQGGGIVAELLVFKNLLSDSERRQVEAYLAAKWLGVSALGKSEIAEGASLSVDENSPALVTESDVVGRGTVAKSGSGRLVVDRAQSLSEVALAVEKGAVEIGQRQDAHRITPVVGVSLAVSPSNITASAGSPERFAVTGTGASSTALLWADDIGGTPIDITGVKTTLTLPIDEECANAYSSRLSASNNLLANGSFEFPKVTGNGERIANLSETVWFWDGEDVEYKPVVIAPYGSTWRTSTTDKVDGSQVLVLTVNNALTVEASRASQWFDAPVSGIYTLRLWMSRRESRSEAEGVLKMKLELDGEEFCTIVNQDDANGNRNNFRKVCVDLPPMTAGRHKFSISTSKEDDTTDRSVIVDGVSLTLSRVGEFVKVQNPGFESYSTKITSQVNNGWYLGLDSVAGWTFEKQPSDSSAGITQNSTYWWWDLSDAEFAETDYRKIFLRNGYAATGVTFPKDGKVLMSFRYSNRANRKDSTGAISPDLRNVGHTLSVALDGTTMNTVMPVVAYQFEHSFLVDVTAGDHALKIGSMAPDGTGDYSSVIDDVRMEYLSGCVANGESCECRIVAPSNGFYAVTIPLGGIPPEYGVKGTVRNNWKYYPARTSISVDGTTIGEVVVEKSERTPFVFRLPYLATGSHTLTVSGVASGSAESAMRYVGVCELTPIVFATPPARVNGVDISLRDGAKLDLQFPGTIDVHGQLKVNGKTIRGHVSSESYPQWVTGPGALFVAGKGFMILIR